MIFSPIVFAKNGSFFSNNFVSLQTVQSVFLKPQLFFIEAKMSLFHLQLPVNNDTVFCM
jgi:hypothetical protein